ncbi:hypothetical protein ALC56_01408 [Trachymyrmex septentrionalis]|uniref:Uncharacterized protein n=1 Tax=Trachymyrmex septentrionalis TaxID=34720 RepID=A0A195FUX6_9HYME|nr:hypothetical protein ALC56_01408 [Trachymyrmex septentrionalis]
MRLRGSRSVRLGLKPLQVSQQIAAETLPLGSSSVTDTSELNRGLMSIESKGQLCILKRDENYKN